MYENIKSIIDGRGLLHRFVAAQAGIPQKSFSAAMNGRRRITVEELVKISQVLKVPVNELLEGVEASDSLKNPS